MNSVSITDQITCYIFCRQSDTSNSNVYIILLKICPQSLQVICFDYVANKICEYLR
jgi:hypothetical protein